ncbi:MULTISPECIES: rod shape-determining protein MreC [Paenibacillus]|uniref:Cell shape-determining protein MreC n=1 Tax=Paenibacillus lactis 154 TaxID=743719 RepID=G4HHV0_9BACL|nr:MULTISPECIES: rod shape-determining protein MreC [Paenibacillus]EHB62923.1 rod shape-determining protein MreC [Paenibacillus lactis 154]MCM3495733.1 rod shape-determining protein MreC [Paenibacillus lactis]GIO94733.1 cell shape-determining protein MreC [Paenibacillus lactis]HAG00117.1 rod shape-determining protein MreC [Paenibacillus lactis]
MLQLFKLLGNKRLFIMLIGLVAFIAIMGFTLGPRASLSWPEKFVKDTVGFVQSVFYKPAAYIAGFFEDVRNMKAVYEENEELRRAVAQYSRESANYNTIKAKYERLRDNLRFTQNQKNRDKYDYRTAEVIAVNSDPNNRTLVVNLGERDGIRPNMSVTTVDGMVGIVSNVSNFTSTVKLLTTMDAQDPNPQPISVTAIGKEDKTFGIVETYDEKTNTLLMTRVAEDDPIAEGDKIISSGAGGVIPPGLIIGTVDSVQISQFGQSRTATITPAAKFEDWRYVIIVVTPEEPK